MMVIENVRVFTPGGVFRKGSVAFGEKIEQVRTGGEEGGPSLPLLIPGLIDMHSHGALNCDHSNGSASELSTMADYYASNGVTSFLATTMTYGEDVLLGAMRAVRFYGRNDSARCIGINMEGPFLSFEKRGAHMAEKLRAPDFEFFARLNDASGGNIRLVSIAPELSGAMEFIRKASKICSVSLAHTAADYDTAMRAFENGANHVTHLFNAMNPFLHRDPGLIGAAIDSDAFVEIIADGVHLHPAVVRAAFVLFGGRLCLISDSLCSAGMPDGRYISGGMPIVVQDGKATLENGAIAGSNISLMEALRMSVYFGVPLEMAVYAASHANARALGMERQIGRIVPGARADMVLLDASLNILKVFINGKEYLSEQ